MHCLKVKVGLIKDPGATGPYEHLSQQCKKEVIRESRLEVGRARLNIPLFKACAGDIKKSCVDEMGNPFRGEGKIMDCLMSQRSTLVDPQCQSLVRKKSREVFRRPDIDFRLQKFCGDLIQRYCSGAERDKDISVRDCLRNVLTNPDTGPDGKDETSRNACRSVLKVRARQSAKSWRLKPHLANACLSDIHRHCQAQYDTAENQANAESEGIVLSCLRGVLAKNSNTVKLSGDCKKHIIKDAKMAAKDYRLSARLKHVCDNEVMNQCVTAGDGKDGAVLKCLRQNLKRLGEIKSRACLQEVINLVVLVKVDIHTDPHLFQTCIGDLRRFCALVKPGEGRLFNCLYNAYSQKAKTMSPECSAAMQSREEMWKLQGNNADSVQGVARMVMTSKSRVSLTSIFMCFVMLLFLFGWLSGRRCRFRRRQEKKTF